MPSEDSIRQILEALLFASDEPIPLKRFAEILDLQDTRPIRRALEELRERYDEQGHAFALEEIAGGYQVLTRKDYAPWVTRLSRSAARAQLSQAALETLAIVAYKQPILRADIEAIRGVQVDAILRTLMERELIKVVGRHDSLGRPLLYGTTRKFLEVFGLKSLDELPRMETMLRVESVPAKRQEDAPSSGTEPEKSKEAGAEPSAEPPADSAPVAQESDETSQTGGTKS